MVYLGDSTHKWCVSQASDILNGRDFLKYKKG